MPRYSTNRELGKLATANAKRKAKAKAKANQPSTPPLPDDNRWDNMKSAKPKDDTGRL